MLSQKVLFVAFKNNKIKYYFFCQWTTVNVSTYWQTKNVFPLGAGCKKTNCYYGVK